MNKARLKEIIREELKNVLIENTGYTVVYRDRALDKTYTAEIPSGISKTEIKQMLKKVVPVGLEIIGIEPLKESVNESEEIQVTEPMWRRMSDDEKIDALHSVVQDPDEALNYYELDWNELPPGFERDMVSLPLGDVPDVKDLSMINRGRAKAALKQIKTGKRSDGMPGPFTARLFGITSSGDVHPITDEDALNQYSKFGLAESTLVISAEGHVNEASDVWKVFDAKQKLYGQAMDLEQTIRSTLADLKDVQMDMEQEAEPEGGPIADKYAREISYLKRQYDKTKTKLDQVFAKLDKLDNEYVL